MVCIYCGSATRVTNSRLQKRLNQIWRRRLCAVCNNTFTTHEIAELTGSIMVRDAEARLRPFSRSQLFVSIYESCKHRPRAVAEAEALSQTVISLLWRYVVEGVVERDTIARVASEVIGRYDSDTGTIYAAFHRLAARRGP